MTFRSALYAFLIVVFPPLLLAQDSTAMAVDSSVSPRDTVIAWAHLADLDGVTFCVDEKPMYFINGDVDGWELHATRVHEEKHREQYRRFKSCAAFDWYYHSPLGRLESETEAYVAGWCATYDEVDDPLRFEVVSIHNIARGGFDIFVVLQTWKKYQAILCPTRPQPSNLAD